VTTEECITEKSKRGAACKLLKIIIGETMSRLLRKILFKQLVNDKDEESTETQQG
jgi:hypothetical protein